MVDRKRGGTVDHRELESLDVIPLTRFFLMVKIQTIWFLIRVKGTTMIIDPLRDLNLTESGPSAFAHSSELRSI
jgi:hypothetical protein